MVCCAIVAALLGLAGWPLRPFRRARPLAWRPYAPPVASAAPRLGFSWRAKARSFGYAAEGLRFLVKSEHNARLHLAASALTVGAGLAIGLAPADWRWVVLAIGLVWSAEAFNTAVERVCDLVSAGPDPTVKAAKDVAAAAVLVSAMAAAAIGAATFLPYLPGVAPAFGGAICGVAAPPRLER